MSDNSVSKNLLGGVMIAVIGGLCISLITGIITYRDIVAQNKFMLTTLQNNQQDILTELKDLKVIVNGLNADYQVLKQDQEQDERDIDRLYSRVYPDGETRP